MTGRLGTRVRIEVMSVVKAGEWDTVMQAVFRCEG